MPGIVRSVMRRLKPTILISLDRYAAAFCEQVQVKLERDLAYQGSLVKSYGLVVNGDAPPSLDQNLAAIADQSFNFAGTHDSKRLTADEAQVLFETKSFDLETDLSKIFEAGRSATEIERARLLGIDVVRNRVIYLLLSSPDPVANGVVIELARLIRWLFATRFVQELYELHAVVLLPNLFAQPGNADFAAAYGLLKKLDHSFAAKLPITATIKTEPFHGCWFIDGINARGEKIGTLVDELDSYSDAFTGFLTTEPETSGALGGTRTCRGKVPVYSTFGHGELYFPVDVALTRLSSALSRDILNHAFLSEGIQQPEIDRKMLLAAKQFVLRDDYRSAIDGIETEKGALIWQDLIRPAELQRENEVLQYVDEQRRQHAKVERESLPKFKQTLLARTEASRGELVKLLDAEIDRRIDQAPEGLEEVPSLLERLIDHSIALHASALGERPQNLLTDLLAAESALDLKLGVTVDHAQTELLAKQVDELNNRVADLENTLRLTSSRAHDADDGATETLESEHTNVQSELGETRSEIATASALYVRELIAEQRAANELRYEAKEKLRSDRLAAITAAEDELTQTAGLLSTARLDLEAKEQQRHSFLVRHFIIYPAVAALLFFVPGLASFLGISFATMLVGLFWASFFGFLLGTTLMLAVYTAVVLYLFLNGINKAVTLTRDEVRALELRLRAGQVRLTDAHNFQLRLEYDFYAQSMRTETVKHLIEVTRKRTGELEKVLSDLRECRARFISQQAAALPASSYMRRPVLSAEQIDYYYTATVPKIDINAGLFIREHVARSQVRHISIEKFAQTLGDFARSRFHSFAKLSIKDVLLRSPELFSDEQTGLRLEELDRAASPLAMLSEMDLNDDTFAQKDVTIWAGATDNELLLDRYRKLNATTTIRPSADDHSLRALTRCLNFPAFYLSQIEFYRSCYDRLHNTDASGLPDVIPDELTISADVRRAYEKLFIGIATGLILKNGDNQYQLVDGTGSLGDANRREIAEKLGCDYRSQKIYADICNRVERCDSETIYNSVVAFIGTAPDLEPFEREMLNALAQKYHPLR